MKVWKDKEKVEMTYEEICHDLGFISEVHFVRITTAGTISFTLGRPNEIRSLVAACRERGYKPAKRLLDAATW